MGALTVEKRAQTESLSRRANWGKNFATFLAALLAMFVIAAAIYMVTKNPSAFGR